MKPCGGAVQEKLRKNFILWLKGVYLDHVPSISINLDAALRTLGIFLEAEETNAEAIRSAL
jgi:hypothetical protein